ncbi:phosphatidylcholine-sterol acyltransferase, putative [Plasmodium malariae]|uniref:Phosphatidylcholine-sterol acyltransferase, putative n=1 Tax=Plasmodium malariae TaxID=5858 RepID=A0A1D3SMP0_PLAMA|nr:phosphatidylcholine-sterol acyltransferase, putative [Plasmodium malariae]SCO93092.1 phosphatidylcholine-sterol acyltransferase, putative [Plasmodium malariae]
MSKLLLLIIVCNLLISALVCSYIPSLGSIVNLFLKAPYKISFFNSEKIKGEIPNLQDGENFTTKNGIKDLEGGDSSSEQDKKEVVPEEGAGVQKEDVTYKEAVVEKEAVAVKEAEAEGKEVEAEGKEVEAEGKEAEAEGKEAEAEGKEVESEGKEVESEGKEVEEEGKEAEAEGKEAETEGKEAEAEGKDVESEGKEAEAEGKEAAAVRADEVQKNVVEEHPKISSFFKKSKKHKFNGESKDENKKVDEKHVETNIDQDKHSESKKLTTYLLPGVGGSTLIAQYKNALIPSCGSNVLNSEPFRIWFSIKRLFSVTTNIYCTLDTIRLNYDVEKKLYVNQPGVNISVEEFGKLKGVRHLDYIRNTAIAITRYYHILASQFTSNGYVEGESIIGAPYDWRYPLNQQDYDTFKKHIEHMYEKRNKIKVNLIGHSFGGLFINFFLSRIVNKEWKQKYINNIIYMSCPFKGTVKTVRALLHGNRDFISFKLSKLISFSVSDGMMKAIGNSIGSLFDLIPYREYYEYDQVVIIININDKPINEKVMQSVITRCGIYNKECYLNRTDIKLKVYTLSNWHELLSEDLKEKYYNNLPYIDRHFDMDHGVPIYCVHSTQKNKNTDYLLFYQRENLNDEPIVYYGGGDGTVPYDSLASCSNFHNSVKYKNFQYNGHMEILHNPEVAKYVYNIAQTYNE